MKSLRYLVVIAVLALAIAPSLAFGQTVYNTGTQGCCDLPDPHYTLVAAPEGVPLGNLYSTSIVDFGDPQWLSPLPGSSWINPWGRPEYWGPAGNYTYRQTFTLASIAGAMLQGAFLADDSVCVTLNGGPAQCTPPLGFVQYTNFQFTTGFQVGTNTLDFVVYNWKGYSGLDVAFSSSDQDQIVYDTGTQGCCDLLDPHYTLVAAPPGVPLGNLYSTPPCCDQWLPPLPGSSWIDPWGTDNWDAPAGNYTYRQTFTLVSTAGAMLQGIFLADDNVCVTLNGGAAQCTPTNGFLQYNYFLFTTGFQVGTNTLDFVVYNQGGVTGLEVAFCTTN